MTDYTQQLDDYVDAYERRDQAAVRAVFASIDDADVDSFLEQLARRLPDVAGRDLSPSTEGVDRALRANGLGPEQSAELSMLATGSFSEWVAHRMRARGIGPDTIAQQLVDEDLVDSDELDDAISWLHAVAAGDVDHLELIDRLVDPISTVLGASPRTVMSLARRQ